MQAPEGGHVVHVLGAPGEHLGDDEVSDIEDRHGRAADVGDSGAIEKLVFEAGPGQHHVERHAGGTMDEGHHPGAPHEIGIIHSECKTGGAHIAREAIGIVRDQRERHVDIRAEAWHAVRDDGLRAEQIPAPPAGEDGRQRGQ